MPNVVPITTFDVLADSNHGRRGNALTLNASSEILPSTRAMMVDPIHC